MDLPRLLSDLQIAEGYSTHAYKDSRGFWTAGYGHFLDQSKDWTGAEFTVDQIRTWLENDTNDDYVQCQKLDEWASLDTDARQNAIVELVFNMGMHKWESFTKTRMDLEIKNWPAAKNELLNSLWAGEVGKIRSSRIANYILSGVFNG